MHSTSIEKNLFHSVQFVLLITMAGKAMFGSKIYKKIKKLSSRIQSIPFHPQWFSHRFANRYRSEISQYVFGTVLDIGCANQCMKTYVEEKSKYIGMDYYQTAMYWYATQPHIYGDAQSLPFADESIDSVLLLDVLEHLPSPDDCMGEISRILKPNGILVIKVPFLYPIHDDPLDFQRWTRNGLLRMFCNNGFDIKHERQMGNPLETAALLMNIAISKTIINWLRQKNPAFILGIIAPVGIILINLLCWFFSCISIKDSMMPHSYSLILEKKKND